MSKKIEDIFISFPLAFIKSTFEKDVIIKELTTNCINDRIRFKQNNKEIAGIIIDTTIENEQDIYIVSGDDKQLYQIEKSSIVKNLKYRFDLPDSDFIYYIKDKNHIQWLLKNLNLVSELELRIFKAIKDHEELYFVTSEHDQRIENKLKEMCSLMTNTTEKELIIGITKVITYFAYHNKNLTKEQNNILIGLSKLLEKYKN